MKRWFPSRLGLCVAVLTGVLGMQATCAAPATKGLSDAAPALSADDTRLLDAREALRKRDRARLAALRDALAVAAHPLAQWADYWELSNRLDTARQEELEAFYARWPGTYVEDRLRNDWLLELGRRRDWARFAVEYPRFRMNDDREVTCYALTARHLQGEDVREQARATWLAQRDGDDGCQLLARTLFEARKLGVDDLWARARLAAEGGRVRAARQALAILSESEANAVAEAFEAPARYLARKGDVGSRMQAELTALALVRLSVADPVAAAAQFEERWLPGMRALGTDVAAWTWSALAKNAAIKLMPEADAWFQRAAVAGKAPRLEWNDETLAWRVRAALRAGDAQRWARVQEAIEAMSPAEQREPSWQYWRARALLARASAGAEGEAQRTAAQQQLDALAGQFNFYGKLASDDLGRAQPLPPRPAPLSAEERQRAEQNPALTRALALIALGLRNEGVREWNFALRDLKTDRELLAAAQRACDREVWDRCINTSERTRSEIDMTQRFPMPFRGEVVAAAQKAGLDPAYVYGLIRQESRFITDARSGVGASGLMQLMPATAKWTARKIGLPYTGERITDRVVNLQLGTAYLKFMLDDFEGSMAMASAGYNAGPGRPRRWRDGPLLEVPVWAESIPFNETRDYVKRVLSNTSYYSALLAGRTVATLKPRLGPAVGPRAATDPPVNPDLP